MHARPHILGRPEPLRATVPSAPGVPSATFRPDQTGPRSCVPSPRGSAVPAATPRTVATFATRPPAVARINGARSCPDVP